MSRPLGHGRGLPGWPAVAGLPALPEDTAVHLVGVGGAGMSGLARVMAERGLDVTGSDRSDSPTVRSLAAWGVRVHVGHDAANVAAECAVVVRSPAVRDDNPEVLEAYRRHIPVTKRAALLGALIDAGRGVSVAGTHGKTTTSGLAAFLAVEAGLDPTYFVGGDLPDLGANARSGTGRDVIVEADEYDRTFLHGHPWMAIVTSVELDHPDIYPDIDAVMEAFGAFVANVRPDGLVLVNACDPRAVTVAEQAQAPVERYAVDAGPPPVAGPDPDWTATPAGTGSGSQEFAVRGRGADIGTFVTTLPGRHNVGNCLAAIACAVTLGIDPDLVRRLLPRFHAPARRFDVIGTAAGVTVVDDYAHHPTEIAVTLAAARERFPASRLWAVVQPHTFSRVAVLGDAYPSALEGADRVVVLPVYAAREAPIDGADADRIARALPGAVAADSLEAGVALCVEGAAAGDAMVFMGAGDVTAASRACLAALHRAATAALGRVARDRGLPGDVAEHAAVGPHTSLRVGGPADLLVRVTEPAALAAWWLLAAERGVPVRVLGRGSNVLVRDLGLPGVVILNRCEGWTIDDRDGTARVVAESGVGLAALAHALSRKGWAGLEAAVGIPGSVGAAVATNAGAHGWSMADSVRDVEVLDSDGSVASWSDEALGFRYRGSTLKHDATRIVLRVALEARREDPARIKARIDGFTARRRATQPTSPSAGSMFKNPPGDYAGRLIEAAGLKELTVGGAQVSPVHANFIVNLGGARAEDVEQLMERIRETVRLRFGIGLEPEIEIVGRRHAS